MMPASISLLFMSIVEQTRPWCCSTETTCPGPLPARCFPQLSACARHALLATMYSLPRGKLSSLALAKCNGHFLLVLAPMASRLDLLGVTVLHSVFSSSMGCCILPDASCLGRIVQHSSRHRKVAHWANGRRRRTARRSLPCSTTLLQVSGRPFVQQRPVWRICQRRRTSCHWRKRHESVKTKRRRPCTGLSHPSKRRNECQLFQTPRCLATSSSAGPAVRTQDNPL